MADGMLELVRTLAANGSRERAAEVKRGIWQAGGFGKQVFLLTYLLRKPECIDLDIILFGIVNTFCQVPVYRSAN